MTREEAISILSRPRTMKNTPSDILEAHEMAIKALEQEPCTDAISRQAAIEGLASIAKAKARSNAQKAMMGRTMFFVEQLPSVSTEKIGWWIPVSERLPDIHNYCMKYLVTDCYGHIHTSLFTESRGKSWWSYSDVIAWMPLPQPYNAESEESDADSD